MNRNIFHIYEIKHILIPQTDGPIQEACLTTN